MECQNKEVFYKDWCHKCQFEKVDEGEDPCNDCLNHPSNLNSHKPTEFKEKK